MPFVVARTTPSTSPRQKTRPAPRRPWFNYQYRDKAGAIEAVRSDGARPGDICCGQDSGKDVPVIVRYETGVINRSAYRSR